MNEAKLTNLFQIKSYIKNDTKLTIEINAEYSQLLQELFLTKKEKNNNRIFNIIFSGIIIISIIFTCIIPSLIFPNNSGTVDVTSDLSKTYLEIFADMVTNVFGQFAEGCLMFIVLIIILIILSPLYIFLEKILVTKIEKITLKFSPNGLEIIPDTPKKEPIFIESLNIADIYLKEAEVVESSGNNSYKRRVLNLILLLHKPIPNKLTNKDIEEIFLLEKIEKIYLEELTEVAKETKEALKI